MSSTEPFQLPEEALDEKFLASTGPGGQNVNKVATAVQLRCDVFKLGLAPPVYARLKRLAGSRMTSEGDISSPPNPPHPGRNREEAGRGCGPDRQSPLAPRKRVKPAEPAARRAGGRKKGRGAVKQGRASAGGLISFREAGSRRRPHGPESFRGRSSSYRPAVAAGSVEGHGSRGSGWALRRMA